MEDPIEAARTKMDSLFRRADGLRKTARADSEFYETFSELLEELEVAGEELRLQNEELMAARSQVEEERARYQELFEFAPDAYLVTSPRGIILEANAAAYQLLNVTDKVLAGKPLVVFVDKSSTQLFHRVLAHPLKSRSLELHVRPWNGETLDAAVTLAAMFDEDNNPVQLRWMMRDITERNQMYAALDQSERRLRAIFNEANTGILLISPGGALVRANPAFLRMVGYTEEELAGRGLGELIQADDYPLVQRILETLTRGERKEGRLTLRCQSKTGRTAWADFAFSPLHGENEEAKHILCITEDISQKLAVQTEMEEMRRRMLESGEVERVRLAQELHDGPMQDLYGLVFRLADFASQAGEDAHEVKSTIEETQETIKHVAGTLRAVCGELRPPTIANLGLERAIRSHAESLQARHPEMKIDLQLTQDNNLLEPHVRMALFRIYQQCITNIMRHAQASKVLVSLFVSDDQVLLDVWDNGKGFSMPEKWVELLREGHYGLAGIAERVDALSGTLKIDTKPGAGTLIHVTVPRSSQA